MLNKHLNIKNLILNSLLFFFSLAFVEFSLRVASESSLTIDMLSRQPGPRIPLVLKNSRIEHRGNPAWFEHDDLGFRNREVPKEAKIVALGDSHTYGTGVELEHSWPRILSSRLETSVYNMGLGGYGATHNYINLIETKQKWQPDLIVFGLYFGNDFFDDFRLTNKHEKLSNYASDKQLIEIDELERRQSIGSEIGHLFRSGATPSSPEFGEGKLVLFPKKLREWFENHSRLYNFARIAIGRLSGRPGANPLLWRNFDAAKESATERQLRFISFYEGKEWKTVFTAPYRFRAMDDADLRIKTGIEISKITIDQMRSRANERGSIFVVLLLPTKEFVFWPRVESPDEHKLLESLASNEKRIRADLIRYMRERNIGFIDPIEDLRGSERQPYFPDADGHPNNLGHEIIAVKVLEFIQSQ